jgi:hypothetical protein
VLKGLNLSNIEISIKYYIVNIENDISIKDIVATTTDDKIKISWKLKNTYQQDIIVNEPFTYIVKFKVIEIV